MASKKKPLALVQEDEIEPVDTAGDQEPVTDEIEPVLDESNLQVVSRSGSGASFQATVPAQAKLHSRLITLTHSLLTSGNNELVQAFHKVEVLTGQLKAALPAAIEAASDAALKADLEALLGML